VTAVGEFAVLRTGVHGIAGLILTGVPPLVALVVVAPIERRRSRSADARLQGVSSA
jgi:hypothetical protein